MTTDATAPTGPEVWREAIVIDQRQRWGWTPAQIATYLCQQRAVDIAAEATREKLERENVPILGTLDYRTFSGSNTERPLGDRWNGVRISPDVHQGEPCHAARLDQDGAAVYVCVDPSRHGGHLIVDVTGCHLTDCGPGS